MAVSVLHDVNLKGAFVRPESAFRNTISAEGPYPPAAGRYALYVSYACPWASRCLAFRKAKGLEDVIGLVVVSPVWQRTKPEVDDHEGWVFDASYPDATADPLGLTSIRALYELSIANSGLKDITTRYTVPVLFDNHSKTIVNNESSEIIRMLNDAFNEFALHPSVDLAPLPLRPLIDEMNSKTYENVCNGVYKCGFAQSQGAYDQAVNALFQTLDWLDSEVLSKRRYLVSSQHITEADVRLFVCLVRFDEVYVVHFKCNKKCIREYPHLQGWLRDVYQTLDLKSTVNMKHIKDHYYMSHTKLNPYGIVPLGSNTVDDLTRPHGREHMVE